MLLKVTSVRRLRAGYGMCLPSVGSGGPSRLSARSLLHGLQVTIVGPKICRLRVGLSNSRMSNFESESQDSSHELGDHTATVLQPRPITVR
jgi:hypothetical protein